MKILTLIFAAMTLSNLLMHWRLIIFIAFCFVAFIQVFYFLFFFARLALFKKRNNSEGSGQAVSVVICARDEARNLSENLPAVLAQEYASPHEVLVVNDNSFDESKYILADLSEQHEHLNVLELTQEAKMIPGKKFPLSIGIKSAKHEILLLTDSDCIPAGKDWVSSMESCYSNGTEIVLGYGGFFKQDGFLNKLIRWETFHSALQYLSYALAGVPYMGVGRNLSYKREVFFRHKGFATHNNIPGGDDDLFINTAATRKNTKINIAPESFTFSKPAATWKQWSTQKKRHYTTGKYYKTGHKILLGSYAMSHFLFYPLLIAAAICFSWKLSLLIFAGRLLIQAVVYWNALRKLGEADLFAWFLIFDLWMFLYYLIFAPALIRKPSPSWK